MKKEVSLLLFFLALLPFYSVVLAKRQPVCSPRYTAPHAAIRHDIFNATIVQEEGYSRMLSLSLEIPVDDLWQQPGPVSVVSID